MDNWQITLLIILALLIVNYVMVKFLITTRLTSDVHDSKEAFEGRGAIEGFSGGGEVEGRAEEFNNDTLYDKFYVKIYDQIVNGEVRMRSEVLFTLGWIKKIRPDTKSLQILDVGCGTGGHVNEFSKEDVGSVQGIDKSSAMIERSKQLYPDNDYMVGDVETPTTFSAGQFNLVTLYYFTIYYMPQKAQILRNIFTWMSPGGGLVIHLVNRDKFDPILESASPFIAFSIQKYSKERLTKSTVAFDKFDYTAEFTNEQHNAQFEETFKFKDGRTRKNVHSLHMLAMEKMVSEIEAAGFIYKEFIDLTPVGYEYQYLFCFVR
jgi:SAM-dependent methyltransferase